MQTIRRQRKEVIPIAMPVEVQLMAGTAVDARAADVISSWAARVLEHEGDEVALTEVCVRVVEDEEGARLNDTYAGKDKPTNVLSFPADMTLPDSQCRILGDIVICAPVVKREATEQYKSYDDHFAHMVVHGMLHLYGYDHADPADADVMEGIEREILGHAGIGDPYLER